VGIDRHIAEARALANAIHARVQGARVTETELDPVPVGEATSDALRHLIAALEDLDRRVSRLRAERPWTS
jgi:hypothetical protein